jgi:hypothetical protein
MTWTTSDPRWTPEVHKDADFYSDLLVMIGMGLINKENIDNDPIILDVINRLKSRHHLYPEFYQHWLNKIDDMIVKVKREIYGEDAVIKKVYGDILGINNDKNNN